MPGGGATPPDGAAFFDGDGLQARLYDAIYGQDPHVAGDIGYFEELLGDGRRSVLDAACGTGRVFAALARPDRRIAAFDASDALLATARQRADALAGVCPVALGRQRLEDFEYDGRFDLIVVAGYGFSYLLSEAARGACLERLGRHLAPGGRAVLHLPAPARLTRAVSPAELAAMVTAIPASNLETGQDMTIRHRVTAMDYDPATRTRSVAMTFSLEDAGGAPLRTDAATMTYACVTESELAAAAAGAGLRIVDLRAGYTPAVTDDMIATLAPATG